MRLYRSLVRPCACRGHREPPGGPRRNGGGPAANDHFGQHRPAQAPGADGAPSTRRSVATLGACATHDCSLCLLRASPRATPGRRHALSRTHADGQTALGFLPFARCRVRECGNGHTSVYQYAARSAATHAQRGCECRSLRLPHASTAHCAQRCRDGASFSPP